MEAGSREGGENAGLHGKIPLNTNHRILSKTCQHVGGESQGEELRKASWAGQNSGWGEDGYIPFVANQYRNHDIQVNSFQNAESSNNIGKKSGQRVGTTRKKNQTDRQSLWLGPQNVHFTRL